MESFDATENCLRGLTCKLLVADGFNKSFERRLFVVRLQETGSRGVDESGKDRVGTAEMLDGLFMHGGLVKKLA